MNSAASASEKEFVAHGLSHGVRADGRQRLEMRSVMLESGVLSSVAGSARCVLGRGQTDVLVGVKADLVLNTEDKSSLTFSVECAATASPDFRGRGGAAPSSELVQALNQFYKHFSFQSTASADSAEAAERVDSDIDGSEDEGVIAPQWAIYVDVVVLQSSGGSLLDAVVLAVRTALLDARLPDVMIILGDEGKFGGVQLDEDGASNSSSEKLIPIPGVERAPVCVTIHDVDEHSGSRTKVLLADATPSEEDVSSGSLSVAIAPDGSVVGMRSVGELSVDGLSTMIDLAVRIGKQLVTEARVAVSSRKGHAVGFLGTT